ncbi:MAG: hypothetical protein ABI296_05440, partial [Gammaproteobacteria bacterium]
AIIADQKRLLAMMQAIDASPNKRTTNLIFVHFIVSSAYGDTCREGSIIQTESLFKARFKNCPHDLLKIALTDYQRAHPDLPKPTVVNTNARSNRNGFFAQHHQLRPQVHIAPEPMPIAPIQQQMPMQYYVVDPYYYQPMLWVPMNYLVESREAASVPVIQMNSNRKLS